jgi:hypothetical protein
MKGKNMRRLGILLAAMAMSLAAPAAAQTLIVEGVASPAWLERGGARVPLATGMRLNDRDRVITGPGARALLRMAEGSAVKLGENAVLAVDDLAEKRGLDVARLVTASLDVLRGAFRFTSNVFGKRRTSRDVKVRITTITAGIRGTDVWGKSADDRDIVCLIEGSIGVEHGGSQFTMTEPLSFFIAPRKDKPLPVAPVDPKQLAQWATETEIAPGSGGARRGGRHYVDTVVAPDQKSALEAWDRLRAAGYPAVIRPVKSESGAEAYRVRVPDLATRQDAVATAEKLKSLGLMEATESK